MQLTDNQTKVHDALPHDAAATSAALADTTGLGYSTVTRLLRELADADLAVKNSDGWRRTGATPHTDPTDIDTEPSDAMEPTLPNDIVTMATDPVPEAAPEEPAAEAACDEPAADATSENPTSAVDDDPAVEPTDDPDGAAEPTSVTITTAEPIEATADAPIADTVDDGSTEAAVPPGPRLRKGELRGQVLAVLRDATEPLGPTQLSKLLDGKSQGAISNACDRLVSEGQAVLASETPRRFAATPTT
jgi:hypothetical protein